MNGETQGAAGLARGIPAGGLGDALDHAVEPGDVDRMLGERCAVVAELLDALTDVLDSITEIRVLA